MEELTNNEDTSDNTSNNAGVKRCVTILFCNRTSLLVLMTGYALLGALLFKSLEGGEENNVSGNVQRSREDCLRELWLITERLNVLYEKNWTRLVTEQLKRFERAVADSGRSGGGSGSMSPGAQWTFGGALLYSITLLTTVGYGKLSPRTALGKVVAIIYAVIGVPLMLILLSTLGSLLASGARKVYIKLCCIKKHQIRSPSVGYQKAPSSPGKHCCRNHEDTASIQIPSAHSTPHHHIIKNHYHQYDHQEVPKRAILATIRSSHSRGRCRQGVVKQTLTDPPMCPQHSIPKGSIVGITTDLEDTEEDDNDHITCSHDTPSRMPLIWRSPEVTRHSLTPPPSPSTITAATSPSVPATLVLLVFISYVGIGAAAFATTSGWSFLDAAYFCFIALSTIGVGDKLPQNPDVPAQMQMFACCLYIFLGLVVVAMCFTLVHEEVTLKCRQIANNMGLISSRH